MVVDVLCGHRQAQTVKPMATAPDLLNRGQELSTSPLIALFYSRSSTCTSIRYVQYSHISGSQSNSPVIPRARLIQISPSLLLIYYSSGRTMPGSESNFKVWRLLL